MLANHVDLDNSKAIHAKEKECQLVELRQTHEIANNELNFTLNFSSTAENRFVLWACFLKTLSINLFLCSTMAKLLPFYFVIDSE